MLSVKEINILVVHVYYLLLKNPQSEFSYGENKMETNSSLPNKCVQGL